MNVDKGAEALECLAQEGLIQVPHGFRAFRYSLLPDFKEIADSSKHGISICLGLPQGWTNGSVYGRLLQFLGTDRSGIEDTVVGQHGLLIDEVEDFLSDAVLRVTSAYHKNMLEGMQVPGDLRGVAYQTYESSQVDFTYFLQVNGNPSHPRYLLQVDAGNPNGWRFQPKLGVLVTAHERLVLREELTIHEKILRDIIEQARVIYSFVSPELDTIVVEGKVMNTTSPVQGAVAIDLYEGYSNKQHKGLDHHHLIQSFSGQ